MKKSYDNGNSLNTKITRGVNVLADNVSATMGPKGRNVILQHNGVYPLITKDGVTVAKFVTLEDPFENAGAQVIKQAAIQTNEDAGDGTTTATVLARSLLVEAQKYIAAGASRIDIKRGIEKACRAITADLEESATPISSVDDVAFVGTISANNDKEIGELIALAIDRVGKDGAITIEDSRSSETSLSLKEGFRFDSGLVSAQFFTNQKRAMAFHSNALMLVTDTTISNVRDLMPILELAARDGRPLVIVAEDVQGEALAACIMNAIRHRETGMGMTVSVLKAPRYGEERREILSDLATVTGATFFSRFLGKKIKDAEMTDFGLASKVEASQKFTTVIDGKGSQEEINTTIESLKSMLKEADTNSESEKIQQRISRMASGVAVIHVGGATSVEQGERKDRIEDALNAVRSAQLGGVVPGGGVALLMSSGVIDTLEAANSDESMGFNIMRQAVEAPFRQMANNAGYSADLKINEIKNSDKNMVCDFRTGEILPVQESGIIDPVKVTVSALINATSAATTLLMADYAIINSENT